MLPRRSFLQLLGMAAAAPAASAAGPMEVTKFGTPMAYVTGSAAMASDVGLGHAEAIMAAVNPDVESQFQRVLVAMQQAKERDRPVDKNDVSVEKFSLVGNVEMCNIDSLRSVSNSTKVAMKRAIAEKCAMQTEQISIQNRIDEMLREHPTLRASKAFMDYINGDGK